MSNISFGSTYIVSTKNNSFNTFSKFQNYALNKEMLDDVYVNLDDSLSPYYPYDYTAQYTMVVPDEMDNEIERYCSYMGIEFSKLNSEDLLNQNAIARRIAQPQRGMIKIRVNAEKLEELIKEQYSNVQHCEKDYYNYFNDNVDYMLKSGAEIPATTLSIRPVSSSNDDLIKYINRFGVENLNSEQIFVDFNQETDNPDHCVYFALRDLGFENVPVYVDSETLQLGEKLGIF